MHLNRHDAERRRRRLRLLAELAVVLPVQHTAQRPRRAWAGQLRELIASRRRLTGTY